MVTVEDLWAGSGHRGQRSSEPRLLHFTVTVLGAVDHDHRDHVAVLGPQVRITVHVNSRPGHRQLAADPGHVRLGLLAEVAAHPGQHRHLMPAPGEQVQVRLILRYGERNQEAARSFK